MTRAGTLTFGRIAILAASASLPLSAQNLSIPDKATQERILASYGELSISFESNQGQAAANIDVLAQAPGYTLLLQQGDAVFQLHDHISSRHSTDPEIQVKLSGSNHRALVTEEDLQSGKTNYFLGKNPAQWHTNIPSYRRIRYTGIYPGIDLTYYDNHHALEHDFVVAPGADPGQIRLSIAGAKQVQLDKTTGDLILSAPGGEMRLHKPITYQTIDGQRREIASSYQLAPDGSAGFRLGTYDHGAPLIIDPTLSYSTYLGGVYDISPKALAVDSTGNAYITGIGYYGHPFLLKLPPGGSAFLYNDTYGGTGRDTPYSVAVDATGAAYVAGLTESTDFPTVNPYQNALKSTKGNAFIAKFDPTGATLVYSTYLGGATTRYSPDVAAAIAVDTTGAAYVAGLTSSTDFPTVTPLQAKLSGLQDVFITKLNPTGETLAYSTYLGGSGRVDPTHGFVGGDYATSLAVDQYGRAFVTGATFSTTFPTKNPIQATLKSTAGSNAFVTEFAPSGSTLVYSTYLGGSASDAANSIALDHSGNAYIAGGTTSSDFPVTPGALQTVYPADPPAGFLAKINTTGSTLGYATYLGGNDGLPNEYGPNGGGTGIFSVAVDASGDAYVTGYTYDSDFPVTSDAFQTTDPSIGCDIEEPFLTKFDPAGATLLYSTYFGGPGPNPLSERVSCNSYSIGLVGDDGYDGYAIALDPLGNAYLTGVAGFSGFPLSGAIYSVGYYGGGFASKFFLAPFTGTTTTLTVTPNPQKPGGSVTFVATVTSNSGTAIPPGKVAFLLDGSATSSYTATVNSGGHAVYTTSALAQGQHTIEAAYSGATNYQSSAAAIAASVDITATPAFSLVAGVYATPHTLALNDSTKGATIYYTTNGANPTINSTVYATPIPVDASLTVKAIAIAPSHYLSAVGSATYTFVKPTAEPAFSRPAGTYTSAQSVAISSSTTGAVLYYTTNNTTPSSASTPYTAPVAISKTTVLKAIAIAPEHTNSPIATAQYTFKAATPVFSLAAGTYSSAQSVTITDPSPGVSIYYTTNGTTPTTSSTKYTKAIPVTATETIQAIALGDSYIQSATTSAKYTIR